MIEKIYTYSLDKNKKTIEKIIFDENVNINHMILLQNDFLPVHFSNSNVYMIIINGTMSINLNLEGERKYTVGEIINIPNNIKMDVRNSDSEVLEFFVVKAPAPK